MRSRRGRVGSLDPQSIKVGWTHHKEDCVIGAYLYTGPRVPQLKKSSTELLAENLVQSGLTKHIETVLETHKGRFRILEFEVPDDEYWAQNYLDIRQVISNTRPLLTAGHSARRAERPGAGSSFTPWRTGDYGQLRLAR